MALLSFEQPFLSLVPFRESLVRTLSIGIFKRCILDSPVKTSSLLVVGAGCLQTCGETKIVERELVGQTTGDFFFFFLLVCFDSITLPGTDPKDLEVRWKAQPRAAGACLLLGWKPPASFQHRWWVLCQPLEMFSN